MPTTTESLPPEVWLVIFEKIHSFAQLEQCSFVNKRWQCLAEPVMFNQSVQLNDSVDALEFSTYLSACRKRQQPVQNLTMSPRHCSLDCFKAILPLVFNKKLKTIEGSADGTQLFRTFLDILDKNRFPKNLMIIPAAWTYSNVYDHLLNRLRNNLVEVKLNFRGIYYDSQIKWRALYRLDKLKKLKSLTFNSYIHDFKQAEDILKNCDQIQELTIHLAFEFQADHEVNADAWIKDHAKQQVVLERLKVEIGKVYKPYLLDYLMFKYPNIKMIIVEKLTHEEPWGHKYYTDPIEIDQINDILDKIKRVRLYQLTCAVFKNQGKGICDSLKSDGYIILNRQDYSGVHRSSEKLVVKSTVNVPNSISSVVKHPSPIYLTHASIVSKQIRAGEIYVLPANPVLY